MWAQALGFRLKLQDPVGSTIREYIYIYISMLIYTHLKPCKRLRSTPSLMPGHAESFFKSGILLLPTNNKERVHATAR